MSSSADLKLSEVIAALSYALDLTDGQPLGHAVRSCLIGMRLADEIGLPVGERTALFYGLLMKDAGCSSNAAKVSALYGGDDLAIKGNVKTINHSRLPEAIGYIVRNAGGARAFVRILRAGPKTARQMTEIRCERGAEIARMLDLPEAAAQAILALDEHWDGRGHPLGLAGEEIPLLGRILGLAQTVEVFHTSFGLDQAIAMALDRSDRWFDPELVQALVSTCGDARFWTALGSDDVRDQVAALEPAEHVQIADESKLDRVAEAFARVIDAKSPYTFRHSARVAAIAVETATVLGFSELELRDLRRAGLLHDIGKLGISNLILDKPGALTAAETDSVRRHPELTQNILNRVARFRDLAEVAVSHHEKLDGSGYHRGLVTAQLSLPARVLAVADIFEALTADRPYRGAMSADQALELMRPDAGPRLCADAFAALEGQAELLAAA